MNTQSPEIYKTLCTSEECLRRSKCGRWIDNYNRAIFERNVKSDLLKACTDSNYANFEEM